jgi:hypothetical protein
VVMVMAIRNSDSSVRVCSSEVTVALPLA